MKRERHGRKLTHRLLFRLVGVLCLVAVIEGLGALGLTILELRSGLSYSPADAPSLSEQQRRLVVQLLRPNGGLSLSIDPELGWLPRANLRQRLYQTNSAGLRANREYAATPDPGVTRIAAYGDSYVYGDDVRLSQTWIAALEAARPDVEVLNHGVSGYGVDQALLRYRRDGSVGADVVVVGFMAWGIRRTASAFRAFGTSQWTRPLGKPRFLPTDGGYTLQPNPTPTQAHYRALLEDEAETLARLGALDGLFQAQLKASAWDASAAVRFFKLVRFEWTSKRLHPDQGTEGLFTAGSPVFQTATWALERFREEVEADGARFAVILFPNPTDLARVRAGAPLPYAPLREALEASGVVVLDPLPALEELGEPSGLFTEGRHYKAEANAAVAESLERQLVDEGLIPWR